MRFKSTRGYEKTYNGAEAVILGLAPDGGLFLPEGLDYAAFPWETLLPLSTMEMSEKILQFFLDDFDDMHAVVTRAYEGRFDTDELTPLKKAGDRFVLELFHGPTAAFKDVALSVLPVLMEEAKKKENVKEETVVLVATSGDTGSAALYGFKDRDNIRIIVFYPKNGVSLVQEAQMTKAEGSNVLAAAVKGNFDDAQTGVKKIFTAAPESETKEKGFALSSANSINIGRLVPQIVYYFKAYAELYKAHEVTLGDPVDFTVPTGNFGDILAGYFAKLLGLPVGKLICASNANNVLFDFFTSGRYDKNREFVKTTSPSMDILVSSNLERLLYMASGEDAAFTKALMEKLSAEGVYAIPDDMLMKIKASFDAAFIGEPEVKKTIGDVFKATGYVIDPHTAVAWAAATGFMKDTDRPMVVLSTASPFKFSGAVLDAIGESVPENEFDAMDRLSEISGILPPKGIGSLREKAVRFTDVTEKEDMFTYVMNKIGEKA